MADSISELERTSKQFRAALLAHDRDTARLLIARYGDVWANIRQRTDALNAAIQQAKLDGEAVKVSWLYQKNRLGILKLQVEQEINDYARWGATQVSGGQAVAVELAQEHARGLVDAQMPTSYSVAAQWTRLPSESVNDLVGFLNDGAPLSNLLAQLGPEASKAIGDALIVGVATGQGPRQVARLVRDQAGIPLQRALVISRNEILRSYRTATVRNYQANSDILKGWVWHSAMDKRECGVCWSKHGSVHPIDEMFASHVQCRCSPAPVTKSWEEILGAKGEGLQETSVQVEPGADVFARLPADQQRDILGPKKQELYQSGQIQLSDLVTPTRSPIWGPGLRESNIAEALEKAGARGPIAAISLPKRLAGVEQQIRGNATETAYVFDGTGKELLRKAGTENAVAFTPRERGLMKGNVLTHNHPHDTDSSRNFSPNDIGMAMGNNLREIRAVGQGYTSSMRFPEGHGLQWADVEDSYGKLVRERALSYKPQVAKGAMSLDDANTAAWHDIWGGMAKQHGWTYERRTQ